MIIDPRLDRCVIWFMDKCKFQVINGTPEECCSRIIKYITKVDEETEEEKRIQWCPVRIDLSGYVGRVYAEHFKENRIKFDVVKYTNDLV